MGEDTALHPLDTMDRDKQLYINADLCPTNTPAYDDDGRCDWDKFKLPL